jgi:hypothetical protein
LLYRYAGRHEAQGGSCGFSPDNSLAYHGDSLHTDAEAEKQGSEQNKPEPTRNPASYSELEGEKSKEQGQYGSQRNNAESSLSGVFVNAFQPARKDSDGGGSSHRE